MPRWNSLPKRYEDIWASRKGTPRAAKVDLKFVRKAADPVLQVFVAKVNQ